MVIPGFDKYLINLHVTYLKRLEDGHATFTKWIQTKRTAWFNFHFIDGAGIFVLA